MNDAVDSITASLASIGITVDPDEVSGIYSWCFQSSIYPVALLYDSADERLLMRIGPVADLTQEEPAAAYRLLDSFMEVNFWLPEGRYAGNEQVYFELPVSLSGSDEEIRDVVSGLLVYADLKPMKGLPVPKEPRDKLVKTAVS